MYHCEIKPKSTGRRSLWKVSEWVCSGPVGLHLCAGGSAGNWHVCNRNHTEIIGPAYVSQRDAECRATLCAYMRLRCTRRQKRVIVRVQGHSGSSGEADVTSRKSDAFSGTHAAQMAWLKNSCPIVAGTTSSVHFQVYKRNSILMAESVSCIAIIM